MSRYPDEDELLNLKMPHCMRYHQKLGKAAAIDVVVSVPVLLPAIFSRHRPGLTSGLS
jgi:hypothetical protein